MDDPFLMSRVERVSHLRGNGQCVGNSDPAAGDALGQRLAVDQLHDQCANAIRFLATVNRRDIRMVQRRQDARLSLEARQTCGVVGKRLWQDLDGDVAAQARVTGAIDLAHPAGADRREDFVNSQAVSDPQRRAVIADQTSRHRHPAAHQEAIG
jgi:hypothetical protein